MSFIVTVDVLIKRLCDSIKTRLSKIVFSNHAEEEAN